MTTIRYQLAYSRQTVTLCDEHRDTYDRDIASLGPVASAAPGEPCVVCAFSSTDQLVAQLDRLATQLNQLPCSRHCTFHTVFKGNRWPVRLDGSWCPSCQAYWHACSAMTALITAQSQYR